MWEEGARIYGIPRVHNNFPKNTLFILARFTYKYMINENEKTVKNTLFVRALFPLKIFPL